MSISLVSAFLNESESVENLYVNVNSIIDEWIVIDTGSTDGTQDKCRALGARVFEYQSMCELGGYGPMRTFGLRQCKCDYALIVDGDERFLPIDLRNIKELSADAFPYDLIWLPRMNYTDWDMRTWDNPPGHLDYQPKFVKVKSSIHWIYPVHEKICGASLERRDPNGPFIRHFGAMKTPERIKQVGEICGYLHRGEPCHYPMPIIPYWQEERHGLA